MKLLLYTLVMLSSNLVVGQINQWQLCNTSACGTFNHCMIESSDTLFSSGCTSVDGGNTWIYPVNGNFAYSYLKTSAGIFSGDDSEVHFSNDNGLSWTDVHTFGPLSFVYGMTNINDTVFASTFTQGIWMSPNNGLNWSAVNTGLPTDSINSIIAVGNNLYAGTFSNGIYYSNDGGSGWISANIGLPANTTVRSMTTDNIKIYASTYDGLFCTDIGVNSWTLINFPTTIVGKIYCVDNVILAGGKNTMYSESLYRSLDQGMTWSLFDYGLPTTCGYVVSAFCVSDSFLFCGLGESICDPDIYRIDRNVVISSLSENLNSGDNKFSVYPNPFQNEISFEINNDFSYTISIYDLTNRIISQSTINRKITLNTTSIEPGIYLYELTGIDGYRKTGKLIKQ